ncbi:hypothetical protein [Eubacterium sp.]|uniref:hypothetical protein n=1 Tax=Eubacterium sp. TaxID=142586 RepID=UPI003995FB3A
METAVTALRNAPFGALLCDCFVILCQNILRCKNFDYMRFRLPLIKKATTFVIAFLVERVSSRMNTPPFRYFRPQKLPQYHQEGYCRCSKASSNALVNSFSDLLLSNQAAINAEYGK